VAEILMASVKGDEKGELHDALPLNESNSHFLLLESGSQFVIDAENRSLRVGSNVFSAWRRKMGVGSKLFH